VQAVDDDDCAKEDVPAAHASQADPPVEAWKLPAAQPVHAIAPVKE